MAAGYLTSTTPTVAATAAAIKVEVDLLNLAATTDNIFVLLRTYRMIPSWIFWASSPKGFRPITNLILSIIVDFPVPRHLFYLRLLRK